jgi:hypothetical protein
MSISSSIDIDSTFTAPTFLGVEGINTEASRLTRDRSYSDAHCLFDKKSKNVAVKLLPLAAAEPDDMAVHESASHEKAHHQGPNRPRSKSESEYRPSHHKKKHTSFGKQSSGTHSPHHGPRPCSPKTMAHPTSCGKMWIRPVAIRKQTGHSSPSRATYVENTYSTSPSASTSANLHVRQVSQSPPDEAEMEISIPMLYSSPSSSFEAYHKKKPVAAFGESGKPIKPISMFRNDSPTDTAAGVQTFQWQR